jgi:flagellar motor switch protein FliN/FliY
MEQNELDNLMKQTKSPAEGEKDENKELKGDDENVTWDDVQGEMQDTKKDEPQTAVDEVHFDEISADGQNKTEKEKESLDLEFILDIPLTLTAELGRSRLLISELLQLGQGSVIELTKLAGEPMDIYVNQRLIARGEVVVVNDKFGVRLSDIVSPAERVSRLK